MMLDKISPGFGNPKRFSAASTPRQLNTFPDVPDLRDRIYEPALLELEAAIDAPNLKKEMVLDQMSEGACTGFALAGIINLLLRRRAERQKLAKPENVSPRMLYEMAKLHDEWLGRDYEGSSIRGALKGFFHNGACREILAPYRSKDKNWQLTVEQAKDARNTGLGAYYRLRPEIIDYHAALNEVGAILVSASIHSGWSSPEKSAKGIIQKNSLTSGGHAFVIVGYDQDGFIVQNSWGPKWGMYKNVPGTAHWSYGDWAENVFDAWVLRLAVPTPSAFDLTHRQSGQSIAAEAGIAELPEPRRQEILGHYVHIDDGKFVTNHRYPSSLESIAETGRKLVADSNEPNSKYDHLLLYAHGGLNSPEASARRTMAMKGVFKRNRIYPLHFMWETGFTEELGDIFKEIFIKSEGRVGFARDALDWAIEGTARGIGRRLWRQMKLDAARAFEKKAAGWKTVSELLKKNKKRKHQLKVHLVGHSAGAILLGELLKNWGAIAGKEMQITSMSLMAPACTLDFFNRAYLPALKGKGSSATIQSLRQYNLTDDRELDDKVGPYGKSLLYFVSNAFEEADSEPLLGMEKFLKTFKPQKTHEIFYAGSGTPQTNSKTHGGFDNDQATMNDILKHILKGNFDPSLSFKEHELKGY